MSKPPGYSEQSLSAFPGDNRTMKTNHLLITARAFCALLLAGCSAKDAPAPVVPEGAQAGELTGLERMRIPTCGQQDKICRRVRHAGRPGKLGQGRLPPDRAAGGAHPRQRAEPRGTGVLSAGRPWSVEPYPGRRPIGCSKSMLWCLWVTAGIDGTVTLSCPEVDRLLKTHTGKDLFSDQARAEYAAAVKQCAASSPGSRR